jgi:outer membrane protein insertion porin family
MMIAMLFSSAARVQFVASRLIMMFAMVSLFSGCAANRPNCLAIQDQSQLKSEESFRLSAEDRLQRLASSQPYRNTLGTDNRIQEEKLEGELPDQPITGSGQVADNAIRTSAELTLPSSQVLKPAVHSSATPNSPASTIVRGQSPDFGPGQNQVAQASGGDDGSQVRPATYQYPELTPQGGTGLPTPRIGAPGEYIPLGVPYTNYADLDVYVQETQTGKINFGGAYNSDNGLVGQFIIDERNFDIRRPPRSLQDIIDGTAWRGGGQAFRLELVPGSQLQRYLVSISEPYFLNTDWSASASAYYFDRIYFDWSERRLGGRLGLGRRIDSDISITTGLRMENVSLRDPRVNTSPILNAALGRSNLFLGSVGLVRDTRDNQFLATTGDYFSATVSQAFGDYTFTRGDIDYRRYRLLYERPDGSGRHTISAGTRLGVSSQDTPIFENYFAGGFSSLRGFDFRGVGPVDGGVRVGGPFEWINSFEYMFPITADDMIKGVAFVDFGTVESSVKLSADSFRVAPGFGFRVHLPAAGFGAPLAFDFGFPVAFADGDDKRVFSFYIGAMR